MAPVAAPSARRPTKPVATYSLIGINVAIFVVCLITAGSFDIDYSPLIQHGELVRGNVVLGEYWRLLTAGFLHYGLLHVAVNMFSLYVLGRDLEVALGTPRFVVVYLISLLGGSAAVMLVQDDMGRSAGASGAIFGLMGAMLVVVLRLRISPTPVLVTIGFNLIMSFSLSGISLPAHIGGLIFGAAATAGLIYAPRLLPAASQNEHNANIVGWAAMITLFAVAIAISVTVALTHTGMVLVYVPPLV